MVDKVDGGQLVSLAAYAKHRKCSTQAVSKAAKRGRITVQMVNGQPKIQDIAQADREWLERSSRRPASGKKTGGDTSRVFTVTDASRFSVCRIKEFVLFGWIVGDEPDLDRDQAWSVTPETARTMADALLAVCE